MKRKYQIDKILQSIQNDDETKIRYVEKIKKYSNECGCSLGANFLMASLAGTIGYVLFFYDWRQGNHAKLVLIATLCVFISSGIGKMIGIGLAKIKLQLLYKSIINQYSPQNQ